ncbi:hypothetical protein [Rickettsiella grylli]|uniref:Lipoprotein n=1 Tax=Rickettsiella grylli TaxID=59196 RepID=A8PPX9_9COXI|nr:hypothetical protein [Rickettsiella grylli]EDP46645.1 hypothetical protein RICGR_1394 [Rickettsiella grylli]
MIKKLFSLLFFSLSLSACHSNLDTDTQAFAFNGESFRFKIIPGKAKTPSSMMPRGSSPIRGPSISATHEDSIGDDLTRCRNHLLNQQVHFELNF